MTRLRNLAQLYAGQLPDGDAQDALVLLFDVCEILGLAPERLERVFGPAVLTWVTGVVYGEGEAAEVH